MADSGYVGRVEWSGIDIGIGIDTVHELTFHHAAVASLGLQLGKHSAQRLG
jgi:hypothetical protein